MEDQGDTDDPATDEFLRNQDGVDTHGKNATADGQQKQIEEESFQGLGSARFAFRAFKLRGCHRFLVPWMNGGAGGGRDGKVGESQGSRPETTPTSLA
jgi:hypothetical protein